MFTGSGQLFISRLTNLVVKGRVDRAFAKGSKRLALKRVRRIAIGFAPPVATGHDVEFQFEPSRPDGT